MCKQIKKILCFCIGMSLSVCCLAESADAARSNAKLGLDYLAKGLYAPAKDRLLDAIHENPHIAAGWYSMGYYSEKTGDFSNAEKYYLKAISVQPHSGSAKNNYGTFLCRRGRYQESIKQFISAAEEQNYLYVAGAYQNAATCALRMGDKSLAMKYFNKTIENNPNVPFALLNLAKLNHEKGDDTAAEKYFLDFEKIALSDKNPAAIKKYKDYVFSMKIPEQLPTPVG